jgi:hypothetical protein
MRFAGLVIMLLAACAGRADRAPDDRGTAKFVLDGVVESVESSKDGEHDWYVVAVRVKKVDKGDGIKPGDLFKVSCYRLTRPKPKTFASVGHDGVPAKGDTIRAFVSDHQTHGGREGVYPAWFDKLDSEKK